MFIENVHEHYQNNYFRMAFLNISRNKFLYPEHTVRNFDQMFEMQFFAWILHIRSVHWKT